MDGLERVQGFPVLAALVVLSPALVVAQSERSAASVAPQLTEQRDGQHDFDFEEGRWKIHMKRLLHPLTGSTAWVEFDGTSITRKVWNGRAWIEEFETDGPTSHIECLTLRLYNSQSRQWRLYWASSNDGTLGEPMIGEFKNGRGEFFDQQTFNGRTIFVRYVRSPNPPNSAHFEQSRWRTFLELLERMTIGEACHHSRRMGARPGK